MANTEAFAAQRLLVDQDEVATMRAAVGELTAFWAELSGCMAYGLVRNIDDPRLWLLWSRWANIGSYRQGLGGPAKFLWLPVMGWVIDEPTAYGDPDDVGLNLPRGFALS